MHDTFKQSWVTVGPPSVMLAHIQRVAKHDTVTTYYCLMLAQRCRRWANISPALCERLVFDGAASLRLHDRNRCTDRQKGQKQHFPISVYRAGGGDIIINDLVKKVRK